MKETLARLTGHAAAVAGLGLLAACGSSTAHHPAAAPSASLASSSPSSSLGPGDLPVKQTVRLRQPFTVSYQLDTGQTAAWRLALDSISCGGSGIFSSKILSAYYSSEGQPTVIPTPQQGMQFCLLKVEVTNLADSNQAWSAENAVTVNMGRDAYPDPDGTSPDGPASQTEQAYQQAARPPDSTFGLNPQVSGPDWSVFEIPAGHFPTSVSVADGSSLDEIGGVQQILIMLSTPGGG